MNMADDRKQWGTVMNIQVQEKQRISCLGSILNYKFFHRPLVQWCYNKCSVTNYVLYCLNVIVCIKHEKCLASKFIMTK
jgi:hypothetical protein